MDEDHTSFRLQVELLRDEIFLELGLLVGPAELRG